MADRYWVGGTGNWSDDTNHWATSSGGAPGGGNKPTASDNAIFDANSGNPGAYTMTVNESALCLDFTLNAAPSGGGTITWTGASPMTISGSMLLLAGMITTYTGTITFNATSAKTITSNAITMDCPVTLDGVGGTWQLVDAITLSNVQPLRLTNGTFDANNQNVTCGQFSTNNSNVRVVTMGSGDWTLTGGDGGNTVVWQALTSTNLTVNRGTSTIKIPQTSATATITFNGGGKTYPSIQFTGSPGSASLDFSASNTLKNISVITPPATIRFTAGTTTTIEDDDGFPSGTLGNLVTITSITAANHNLLKTGNTGAGDVLCDFLSISRSQASPSRTWLAGDNSTNGGNNSGWIFDDVLPKLSGGFVAFFTP